MNKILRPFQKEGARFLATHPHALLADEPGLGKTVQAIAAVEACRFRHVLVVCPASVRLGWRQEIEECLGSGHAGDWDIISYNEAVSMAANIAPTNASWDVVILDEAHFLKTPESQRTQAIFGNGIGLARRARFIWCLTGTPVLNRPRELYPVLKTLDPRFAGMSFASFAQRYCGAFFDGRSVNTRGASNLAELAGKLDGFMLRRTKEQVLPELPPAVICQVPLEVSKEDLAAVWAEEDLIENREAKISSIAEDFSQLGDLSRLLRLTGEAKVKASVSFILDTLQTVEKVVVFARHRSVLSRIQAELESRMVRTVEYHGGMSDVQKRDAIYTFSEGKGEKDTKVFIGQIQAAGTGINGLQDHCSTVIFAELSWVPGDTQQAIDRLHRMGQSANSVNVYVLHVPGTLESAVLGTHTAKEKIIEKIMGAPAL